METKEKEFIELDFSARVKEGELFDTTRKEEAKKLNIEENSVKPLIMSIGSNMVVPGLDKELVGKEIGKKYEIEICPEEAFGKRDPTLIQMVSLNNFKEQEILPQKGMQFSLDGRLARVLSVSGGRVLMDFNNILAGKNVIYDYEIKRIVNDKKEQLDALQEFFFKKKFDSEIGEKEIKIKVDKEFSPLFDLMKKRFEEILGLKISLEVLKDKKA
jgi:FKBP-type peptidyl-prolyl cis-trans isomerase SlyD